MGYAPVVRPDPPLYSIGAVERMLGIPSATLRNWEERYGVVEPERSAGGHRLYSRDQLEHLRFVKRKMDLGLNAADAHRLLAELLKGGDGVHDDGPGGRAPRLVVLVAERDPFAAELAEFFLRTEGYEVVVATDAEGAERGQREKLPDLAIVELLISGGAGAALCRRMKDNGVPACLVVSPLQARDEALAAGADAFLQKPLDPLQLVSAVKDLLGRSALLGGGPR
jgi:DNA-binding transcriptional MerR regulator